MEIRIIVKISDGTDGMPVAEFSGDGINTAYDLSCVAGTMSNLNNDIVKFMQENHEDELRQCEVMPLQERNEFLKSIILKGLPNETDNNSI